MIEMILFCLMMLIITVLIQFILFKTKKSIKFWSGNDLTFIMSILGIISNDISYFAGIIGYIIGDLIGKFVGWHKLNENNK